MIIGSDGEPTPEPAPAVRSGTDDTMLLQLAVPENESLRQGLLNRTMIGQAQGLLMAWFDIDADQAFAYLRRRSMDENKKLVDIAATIVRTRRRPHHSGLPALRQQASDRGAPSCAR